MEPPDPGAYRARTPCCAEWLGGREAGTADDLVLPERGGALVLDPYFGPEHHSPATRRGGARGRGGRQGLP
jgi:hypothetical protein